MARRTRPDGPSGDASPGVDPNLALFASYVREDREKERAAKQAARAERRKEEEAATLVAAKDAAAAEVKRLRSRTGVSPEERVAAEAAYRDALAAVVATETGEAPAWAPERPPEPAPVEADETTSTTGEADGADETADGDPET